MIPAIAEIGSVPGLEVLHIDPDELVWAAEIAERTGRRPQNRDAFEQLITS